jgi:hypothetical protein
MRVAFAMAVVGIASAGAATSGCTEPTGPRTVASEDLSIKIPAMREAGRTQDLPAAPQMVKDLESDDAVVRLFAIKALEDMNGGDSFGYVYYADLEQRRPAVLKWRKWLQQQGAATRPAGAGAGAGAGSKR